MHSTCSLYASVNSSSGHPPLGNRGAFAHVVSPGGGTSAILSRPGGWAFAYPGATPGHSILESAIDEFIGKDEAFVEQWLARQGLEKLVDVFKGMFMPFLWMEGFSFVTCI